MSSWYPGGFGVGCVTSSLQAVSNKRLVNNMKSKKLEVISLEGI